MKLIGVNTGKSVSLVKELTQSGEAKIWYTDRKGYLAKIYHSSNKQKAEKLRVMIAHPPEDPNSSQNHISFAWPQDLLMDSSKQVLGFLMPEISQGRELLNVCNPQRRKKQKLGVNWRFLHTTALNIASVIEAIHMKGYVLGDIKPQNILVNDRALPSIIDTDSFQICNPSTGQIFRCLVGSSGYTPIELLGKDFDRVDRTEIHDRFGLAVIIHLLLFGDIPFKGEWLGVGEQPDPNELLRLGFWPYAPNSLIKQGTTTIPLSTVHPEVQQCFLRCFNQGHMQPSLRPTAQEWHQVLKVACNELTGCERVDEHIYSRTYGRCYWCERKNILGVDVFDRSPATLKPVSTTSTLHSNLASTFVPTPGSGQQFPAPRSNPISSSTPPISVTQLSPSERKQVLKWTISTSLAVGSGLWLLRTIFGNLSESLNTWALSYPIEVLDFPFKVISQEELLRQVEPLQWSSALLGILIAGLYIFCLRKPL